MSRAQLEFRTTDRRERLPRFPSRVSRPRSPAAFAAMVAATLPFFAVSPSRADGTVSPYVSAQVQHDSNVFRVPNSETILLANGDPTMADTEERYLAGLDATYQWSQQKLTATLEGRHLSFNHYKDLDHTEYLADVALDWKLTHVIDGSFDLRQERLMAPFELGNSSRLTINVDRNARGKLNLNVTPDWRIDFGGYYHKLDSPLQNFPDFVERDIGSHAGLTYVGFADLTYGLAFDHVDGRYENAVGVGPFNQNSGLLNMSYKVSGLTTLNASAGYSRRNQSGFGNNLSAFTGQLGYTRQLTGKTSINLNVTRAVNSYLAAGGSEIDTTGTARIDWEATYRISVVLSGGYVHSSFVGQFVPGSTAAGRVDRSPYGELDVTYRLLRRLQLHAYVNQQKRRSNVELYNFSDVTYGIDARFAFR